MLFFHSRQELAVCLVDALVLCSAADAVEEHEATDAADDLLFDANEKMHYFAKKNIRKLPTHVNVGLDTCLHRVEKECKKKKLICNAGKDSFATFLLTSFAIWSSPPSSSAASPASRSDSSPVLVQRFGIGS